MYIFIPWRFLQHLKNPGETGLRVRLLVQSSTCTGIHLGSIGSNSIVSLIIALGQYCICHSGCRSYEDSKAHDDIDHSEDFPRSGFRRKISKSYCRNRHNGKIDGIEPTPPFKIMIKNRGPKDHTNRKGKKAFNPAIL